MMKLEIFEEFSGSSDQMNVKGKRTNRPRSLSSTSSIGSGCGGAAEFYNLFVSSPSPTTSTSTEEDEDMANCLILLARGSSPPQQDQIKTSPAAADENKFCSRKFAEMATTTAGKVGISVYECKTCNRTFPSFQALGGHRASHKRPKTAAETDQRKSPPSPPPPPDYQEEGGEGQLRKLTTIYYLPRATQSPNKNPESDPKKPKMHECSICGSEFGSGQALGGHMRRHRPPAPPSTSAKVPTIFGNNTSPHEGEENARNMFALDLNLPAPPEDEKLPKPEPPHVVFSAAALVDCHY